MSSHANHSPAAAINAIPAGVVRSSYPPASEETRTTTASLAARVWFASLCIPGILACALSLI